MAKIKLKRTLYVGIGGTGVATLLKVKKCFYDSYGEIPPMIGFLAIDTDGGASNKSITSNRGESIQLDASELLVCTVKGALQVYQANPKMYGWVPDNNVAKLTNIRGGGAGQVRSNGRFIAYYNKSKIDVAINVAKNKITAVIPQDSKYEVDLNSRGLEYRININVVGSIAGGTGSGMMVDVLCIIREALQLTTNFRLNPWIVLPDVFKAMNTGPNMSNVMYNSYGALRELDYIMHYNPENPAINFGYAKIDSQLFDYAYIVSNLNTAGVSFNTLDDLTDAISKSMYLPATKMGDDINTPFDNVSANMIGDTYTIINKKAWAASASSAELIYDSQAVCRSYAYRIINQLCISMLQAPTDGTADANRFVNDPMVKIMEHEADDVIDALLSPGSEYPFNVDENTTMYDIDGYISSNCDENRLVKRDNGIEANMNVKFVNAKRAFEQDYIPEIMCRTQGKVDAAIKFIEALQSIIAICKKEMTEEGEYYKRENATPAQLDVYLNAVTNKGIASIFNKTNNEAIEALQLQLERVVTNKREELRRKWALIFYNKFEIEVINPMLQKLESLKSTIDKIAKENQDRLIIEQSEAQKKSNFLLFLHDNDVNGVSGFSIDGNMKSDFVTYLGEKGLAPWIDQSKEYISDKLWNFAKDTQKVKEAVNTDIDDVLKSLPQERVIEYLDRLALLASPLWTHNTLGFASTAQELDRFVVVGVGNRDTSILATDPRYNTHFDSNENTTSFASTNQNDRVYVLVVEDLLPIYAVNNFKAYEQDYVKKSAQESYMSNYLDTNLNNRIESENFSMLPVIEKDNVLQHWVMGFVFDLIHYDTDQNIYWVRSKKHGNALKKYRFDLNKSRDVAYDLFKSEQIYKEIEDTLNAQIAKTGKDPIDQKINNIKNNDTYLEQFSQLSPLEQENIENPKFRAVKDLMEKEIALMTE